MAYLFGTDTAAGVPVSLAFSFNGSAVDWGSTRAYHIEPITNKAESIDGNYQISDLDVEFIDTDGSLWTALGHGTSAFNKQFSLTAYVGGTMDYTSGRLKLQNTGNSATFTVHQGKVTNVWKKDRLVRVKSKNNLRLISDLEWRFPYRDLPEIGTRVGTYFFFEGTNLGSYFPNSVFDVSEDQDDFEIYSAVATTAIGSLGSSYPSVSGRGTLGLLSGYHYPGTQFYFEQNRFKFKGTFLGTKIGTINTIDEANRFGFPSLGEAESAKSGSRYVLNRSRLHLSGGTVTDGNRFFFQQKLTLSDTPANLFRELIAGHCVSPYFGTGDIESNSFATSAMITTYQTFSQDISPKETKVGGAIKNLLESVYGLFSVNVNNQFEFRAYGPRNLQQTIGSIGTTDILEAEQSNDIEDFFNRVVIRYGHDVNGGEFQKTFELKTSDWGSSTDRPYELESKWLKVDNEASILAQRLLNRFKDTVPKVKFKVPLKYAGVGLGSIFFISDVDSGLAARIVELTAYRKDFSEDRTIEFEGADGGALYNRKGFGYWGPGTALPGVAVSGTSTFGWGTNGTVNNINGTYFGSFFAWW
jgi:hypothetical protein